MPNFFKSNLEVRAEITKYGTTSPIVSIAYEEPKMFSTEITSPYTWKLFPKDGYEILVANLVDNYNKQIPMTILEDGSAILENTTLTTTGIIEVREKSAPTPSTLGFNHAYVLSEEQLNSLSNDRFTTGLDNSPIDLGKFFISLIQTPFMIPDELKGTDSNIILGNYKVETKGTELLLDVIEIDLGVINIPLKYNNAYDFVETKTILHLPFVENIDLPIEYVVGQTISIKYIFDVYSGETIINLSSSKIQDNIFYSTKNNVGRNIPFVRNDSDVMGSQQTSIGFNNDLTLPFVEVIRNEPYNSSLFSDETIKQTKLINEKGYVVVENIHLILNTNSNEYDNIINRLKEGVFIK